MSASCTRWRRGMQFAVAAFYLLLPVAHRFGLQGVEGNLASVRLGPLDLTEPAAALSAVLAAQQWTWTLVLGAVPVVLLALVLGPVFCSWICPWGLLSEGIDHLRQRRRRRLWDLHGYRRWSMPRILILVAVLLASLLLGSPLAATLSAPRLMTAWPAQIFGLGMVAPLTGILLLLLLLFELLGPRRAWCRGLCPVGGMAHLLRTPVTLRVRFDGSSCLCPVRPVCQITCPNGIDPRHMRLIDGCTNCLACIDHCPSGALLVAACRPSVGPRGT